MGKEIIECWKHDIWLKILTVVSIILIIVAFFVPPTAYIDGSVLAATGELAGIGAIWEFHHALDKNANAKIKIKEIELEITQRKAQLQENNALDE